MIPLRVCRAWRRRAGPALLFALLAFSGGCDRIRRALNDEAAAGAGDPVWQSDSTMLASTPNILFRVFNHANGRAVAPIATFGTQGFRQLTMGGRGWRAFDLNYLQAGHTLRAVRDGLDAGEVRLTKGMWEQGAQLDTLRWCGRPVPAGLVNAPSGVTLAIAGERPALKRVAPLSAGELQEALSTIPTLIAPSSGISTSMLARYTREVRVLATGAGPRPSILVIYNDPEQVSDTLKSMAQRPRQFIVVLDKGVYGFRPTFTFATLGNALSEPRMAFLDYVDVDGNGKAELFFTFLANKKYEVTSALRFENEVWREVLRQLVRCEG